MLLVAGVELGDAAPARRTLYRDRLLLGGELLDARVENARELLPLVA